MQCENCGANLEPDAIVCDVCEMPVRSDEDREAEAAKGPSVRKMHFGSSPKPDGEDWELKLERLMADNRHAEFSPEPEDASPKAAPPEAKPVSAPKPKATPKPAKATPEPKPESKPAPAPEPKPESKPKPKPEPAPESVAAPQSEEKHEETPTMSDSKPEPRDENDETESKGGDAQTSASKPSAKQPKPALGESPLQIGDEPRDTSEELKRVLQTVFTSSRSVRYASKAHTSEGQEQKPFSLTAPPMDKKKPKGSPPPLPAKKTQAKPVSEKPMEPAWAEGEETGKPIEPKADPIADKEPRFTPPEAKTDAGEDGWSLGDTPEPLDEAPARERKPKPSGFFKNLAEKAKDAARQKPAPLPDDDDDDEPDAPEVLGRADAPRVHPQFSAVSEATARMIPDDIEDDDEPPESEDDEARYREEIEEVHVTVAGTLRRMLAGLIDVSLALLLMALFVKLGVVVFGSQTLPETGVVALAVNYPAMWGAYAWLFLFFYASLSLAFNSTTGQSVGAMLLGLKIIRTDGETLGFGRALVRLIGFAMALLPFFLGLLWMVVDTRKQGLHDKMAHSLVIRL